MSRTQNTSLLPTALSLKLSILASLHFMFIVMVVQVATLRQGKRPQQGLSTVQSLRGVVWCSWL